MAIYLLVLLMAGDRLSVLIATACVTLSALFPFPFFEQPDIIFTFVFISVVYCVGAVFLVLQHRVLACFAMLVMAGYSIVFAIDSWIYSDVKTWIWLNHEIIVSCIHAVILLSFSRRVERVANQGVRGFYRDLLADQHSNSLVKNYCCGKREAQDTQ